MRLHHLADETAPWAVFEEVKGKKFANFNDV